MALLFLASLPLQVEAAKKTPLKNQTTTKEAASKIQAPADFADAFHEAMRSRNREKVLSMLAPDLVVFETGYLQSTRDEYVKNNLSDDIKFASALEYRPLSRGVIGSGESMTVLTKASIRGVFGDQRVDLVQSETMTLRRTKTSWEIVHLHWSAHPRSSNDPEGQGAPSAMQFDAEPLNTLRQSTELTAPSVPEAKPAESKTP